MIFDKIKKALGMEVLSEYEKKELEEARSIIPKFNKTTGEEYEWYYYFKENPIPPYNEKTGKPVGYGKRELVIEHNFGVSGTPTFWNKEKGVHCNHPGLYIIKNIHLYTGPGKKL